MKTRTDEELKNFAKLVNVYSLNYAMGKKYGDHTLMDASIKDLMDISLKMFTELNNLLNSEGYYVEKIGTDHSDNFDVTYSTYDVKESDL